MKSKVDKRGRKPEPEFVCRRCGNCCQWEGEVRVKPAEIEAIAAHLGMTAAELTERHTRLTHDRRGLSLTEREDGGCIFYEGDPPRCRIYAVRPQQCRDFPRGWNFPGWRKECQGGREESAKRGEGEGVGE